ncbi:MAG: hypothetical protein Q8P30_01145 [Candidatus Uhrbacteria bacterium]|nr:hypothetical protein [Candidatus Uhrbacteria bacterium]
MFSKLAKILLFGKVISMKRLMFVIIMIAIALPGIFTPDVFAFASMDSHAETSHEMDCETGGCMPVDMGTCEAYCFAKTVKAEATQVLQANPFSNVLMRAAKQILPTPESSVVPKIQQNTLTPRKQLSIISVQRE